VGAALVRTVSDRQWTVTCVEYPYGVVRLEQRAWVTQVVVGDGVGSVESQRSEESFAAAACTVEGELLVAVRSAPPAIVVGAEACRIRPSEGATHDSAFPDPGERLILLSCAVFESVPDVLVDGVNGAWSSELSMQDPESLLLTLLGEGARGAGVIIDRHPSSAGEGGLS